jgi:hypothetical protein
LNKVPLKFLSFEIHRSPKVIKLIIYNVLPESIIEIDGFDIKIQKRTPSFSSQKVIYTLQKNNSLDWIRDWVLFYKVNHKIDNFIIYDNNSDIYSIEMLDSLLDSLGIRFLLVKVPFLYGPGAFKVDQITSNWDSDFLQYAMLEHARLSCFDESGIFLNVDIDEYVLDISLFDKIINSNAPAICFKGIWTYIDKNIKNGIDGKQPLLAHHSLLNKIEVCPNKWIANLSKLSRSSFLEVHTFRNQLGVLSGDFYYAHMRGLSTGWKYARNALVDFNPEVHEVINFKNYLLF